MKKLVLSLMVLVMVAGVSQAVAILYDFEGDTVGGSSSTDKLVVDGSQNGVFHDNTSNGATVTNVGAKFGNDCGAFGAGDDANDLWNTLEIDGSTSLGSKFTFSIMFNLNSSFATSRRARLFSSYSGTGSADTDIIIDANPDGGKSNGFRMTVLGQTVLRTAAATFTLDEWHHVAVVYDDGDITLYFDGEEVGSGSTTIIGDVTVARNILVGEDVGGANDDQIWGRVDDVLIYDDVLSAADIVKLGTDGAGFLTPETGTIIMIE